MKLIKMNEIQAEPVSWLWYPYIPYGKITLIQGDPGVSWSSFFVTLTRKEIYLVIESSFQRVSNIHLTSVGEYDCNIHKYSLSSVDLIWHLFQTASSRRIHF